MANFNTEIMKKVEQKEKEGAYFRRCLAVDICPECGDELKYEFLDDGEELYICKCGFKHSK